MDFTYIMNSTAFAPWTLSISTSVQAQHLFCMGEFCLQSYTFLQAFDDYDIIFTDCTWSMDSTVYATIYPIHEYHPPNAYVAWVSFHTQSWALLLALDDFALLMTCEINLKNSGALCVDFDSLGPSPGHLSSSSIFFGILIAPSHGSSWSSRALAATRGR